MSISRIIGIYDSDIAYGDSFSGYINQRDEDGLTCVAFGSLDYLKHFQEKRTIDILLVSEDFYLAENDQITAARIYILSEEEMIHDDGLSRIAKYQSVERVLKLIKEDISWPGDIIDKKTNSKSVSVFGVFSPLGRCQKTSFALTLGQLLARQEKVLYISLEEYGAFPGLKQEGEGLSGLFYHFLKGGGGINDISPFIISTGALHYIPPVACPEDLLDFSTVDTVRLIEAIGNLGHYETIIIDIGHGGRNPGPLFDICKKIYMPVRDDTISRMKTEAFESYLSKTFRGDILAKTQYLTLPYPQEHRPSDDYLNTLLWGQLGDFVRALLGGG